VIKRFGGPCTNFVRGKGVKAWIGLKRLKGAVLLESSSKAVQDKGQGT